MLDTSQMNVWKVSPHTIQSRVSSRSERLGPPQVLQAQTWLWFHHCSWLVVDRPSQFSDIQVAGNGFWRWKTFRRRQNEAWIEELYDHDQQGHPNLCAEYVSWKPNQMAVYVDLQAELTIVSTSHTKRLILSFQHAFDIQYSRTPGGQCWGSDPQCRGR